MEIETEWLRAGEGGAGRVCCGAQGGESVVASWRGVRVTRVSPAGVGGGGMVASGLLGSIFRLTLLLVATIQHWRQFGAPDSCISVSRRLARHLEG